jgi:GNAT superfamily N-acetyltransferase
MRFAGDGEALFAAHVSDELAGIGGLTRDPFVPGCLRMRRFYVRQRFRRSGVGRMLARALLDRPERGSRPVTVNAGTGSEPFWESLGFAADTRDGHSHILTAPP